MPNHVINILTAPKHTINSIKGKNGDIDFNQIIKMPKILNQTNSPNKSNPKQMKKHYKAEDWYEWAINNWGTKWNAYQIRKKNTTTIIFQTAWSTPLLAIEKLSKKFPKETIKIEYADESIGENCGIYWIENGILRLHQTINKKDAKKLWKT